MRAGPRVSREQRFFEKVRRVDDGCWEWLAKKNNKGYGMFGGTKAEGFTLAHRAAYEIARGKIPKGKWVLHSCDNRGCVNPDHLFLGTHVENMRDMHSKGRGRSILGPAEAMEIAKRRKAGERRGALAVEFGVSVATIKNITMGRSWSAFTQAGRTT